MVACRGNKLVGSTLDWFVSHFQKNQLDRRTPLREEEDRTGHLVCLDYFYIPFVSYSIEFLCLEHSSLYYSCCLWHYLIYL